MKSIKLHITHLSDPTIVEEAQRQYTNAFMLLYNMFDKANDKEFVKRFMQRFDLTDIGYRSLVQEVQEAIKQDKSNDDDALKFWHKMGLKRQRGTDYLVRKFI